MAEDIGSVFSTKVPSYTEAADIRKAFNLYHYGSEIAPPDEESVNAVSIAGYLKQINADLEELSAGITAVTQLEANEDLDDIYQNGLYLSAASPTEALGYPEATSGYLQVVSKADPTNANRLFVFQRYQTLGISGGTDEFLPQLHWRSGARVNNVITWNSSWRKASVDGHLHNSTYYTIPQIDGKITTTLTASRAAIVNADGKLTHSDTVTKADVDKLVNVNTLGGTVAEEINDRSRLDHLHDSRYYLRSDVSTTPSGAVKMPRVYVQQEAPTGAQINDLWFW